MLRAFGLILFGVSTLFCKPLIVVSIPPQEFIVKKIANDSLDTLVMAKQGANHETYEPKPDQMRALSRADIYFTIGLPFEEAWEGRFRSSSPKMALIDTSRGVKKIKFEHEHENSEHDGHKHQMHESHEHGEFDPHIWLDPQNIKIQAQNILSALTAKYPTNAKLYQQNYEAFAAQIDKADSALKDKLSTLKHRTFFAVHPSFGYFAARYDLEQLFMHAEGSEPKPSDLIELIKEARAEKVRAVLLEPQASKNSANLLARELGAKIIDVDPMSADTLRTLEILADKLLELDSAGN